MLPVAPAIAPKRRWRFRGIQRPLLISAALTVLFVLAVLWLMAGEHRLEIRRCESAAPLLSLEMETGSEFSIWSFHTYDRAFFEEHYRLEQDGRIVLTRMTFKSSLNGQGFSMGVYRPRPDGSAELADINKDMPEILFRLGSPDLANHTLFIGGHRLRLLDYAEAGDMICIRSEFRFRWQLARDRVRAIWPKENPEPSRKSKERA